MHKVKVAAAANDRGQKTSMSQEGKVKIKTVQGNTALMEQMERDKVQARAEARG